MTIGSGLAIASAWAAVALTVCVMRKDISPFGALAFLLVGALASRYIVGIP